MSNIVKRSAYLRVPVGAVNLPQLQKALTIVDRGMLAQMEAGLHDHALEPPNPYLLEYRHAEGDDVIYVPRRTKLPKDLVFEDDLPAWDKKYKFTSKVTPRPHQVPVFDSFVRDCKIIEGILALNVGRGKTVLALHALSKLNTAAVLVVTPNGSIMAQWRARALEFLDISEDDIGQIGDGVMDVAGKKLVIGIIDSVAGSRLPQSVYDLFETIIIDEAHRISTREGRQLFWRFPGRRLALSATWERRDGLHKLLELHVGPVLHEDSGVDLPIKGVYMYETGLRVRDPSHMLIAKGAGMTPKDRLKIGFNSTGVFRELAKRKDRNDFILTKIHAAAAKGRSILALGGSLSQLKYIHDNARIERKCLITGAVDMDDRVEMMQGCQLVVATDKLASMGLDLPALDTLILMFPQQPHQCFGRIQRAFEGKQPPVVVCFTDRANPSAAHRAVKFVKQVEALGYPVFNVAKEAASAA